MVLEQVPAGGVDNVPDKPAAGACSCGRFPGVGRTSTTGASFPEYDTYPVARVRRSTRALISVQPCRISCRRAPP